MSSFELQGPVGPVVKINERNCTYFGGTSYFCLQGRDEVIRASSAALYSHGTGAASSRISLGATSLLRKLEQAATRYFDAEDAVYLASGFLSGLAAMQSLGESADVIVIDEATHFSNLVAAKSLQKPLHYFSHLDVDRCESLVQNNHRKGKSSLIVTDGIFPAYGIIAPIADYLNIAETFNSVVWMDDAHGIGVMGGNGRGTSEYFDLTSSRLYFGGSLAKAVGGFGGIIPGSAEFVGSVKRNPVAVTASLPSTADMMASYTGLTILQDNPAMRTRLWDNARYIKTKFNQMGIDTENSVVPIIGLKLKDVDLMVSIRDALFAQGMFIQLVQGYGQQNLSAMLRICVFSEHTHEQIDQLCESIGSLMP